MRKELSLSYAALFSVLFHAVATYPAETQEPLTELRNKRDVNIIQSKLIQTLNPQPVLDTAKESEKCCNTMQHVIGDTFVKAYETVSSAIQPLLQIPMNAKNAIGQQVTQVLDMIGGKLVGLQ